MRLEQVPMKETTSTNNSLLAASRTAAELPVVRTGTRRDGVLQSTGGGE